MTLVTLDKIHRAFGEHEILTGASLRVEERERIGVIGDNGAGKTTLIRILAGSDAPDTGERRVRRDLTVAYGEQMPDLPAGSTVLEAVRSGNGTHRDMEERIRTLEARLAEHSDDERLLDDYGHLQAAFEAGGGYERAHHCERVLDGLGFGRERWQHRVEVLSGGELSRLQLAVLMTTPADLLVLDEPTNHLDLEGIEFVEGFVQRHPGAVVAISHDRRFLDGVATRIVEVDGGVARSYRGNYSAYVKQRDAWLETERRAYKKQREHVDKELAYIRRNMAGRMSAQAKGRLKRLERLERLEAPRTARRGMRLGFAGRRGLQGQTMIEAEGLELRLPDGRVLLEKGDLRLVHGEVLGLLGRNGAGKTTLLRALVGASAPASGTVELAHGARIGTFSQDTSDLPDHGTVLEVLRAVDREAEDKELRDHLALFLFHGDEAELPVTSLSGGERQRLELARLTRTDFDLLCLDEPTNHLDIATAESLTEALRAYPGAVMVISHDRQVLEEVTDRVAWLGDARLRVFDGGLAACLETLAAERRAQRGEKADRPAATPRTEAPDTPREDGRVRNPMMFARLEERIMALEEEIETLEGEMARPEVYQDHVRLQSVQATIAERRGELETRYREWESW